MANKVRHGGRGYQAGTLDLSFIIIKSLVESFRTGAVNV